MLTTTNNKTVTAEQQLALANYDVIMKVRVYRASLGTRRVIGGHRVLAVSLIFTRLESCRFYIEDDIQNKTA